ncbi:MAG: endonuclease/exonuclease/phosphatase family protein [Tepidisphaeraceae bacterium]
MALIALVPLGAMAQSTQTIRIVTYNTQGDVSSPTPSGVLPYITTVLEGIGEEDYVGDSIQQLPDIIALQETTSNSTTVAPIVSNLNTYYGSSIYNYSTYQGTEEGGDTSDGNGPNALIYNQNTINLIASVGIGTPEGSTNGEYRQVVRYEFQPKVDTGTSTGIFYVYDSHAKSLSDGNTGPDQTAQQEEATLMRTDEATLPTNSSVLYVGDFNVNASTDPSMVEMTSSGQGKAYDPLNPTNASENWATQSSWPSSTAYDNLLTENTTYLDYRDDFQFVTSNVLNDSAGALDYVANSEHVFGNNGSTPYDKNVTNSANTAFADINGSNPSVSNIIAAMNKSMGSDHYPVVADFTISTVPEPASLGLLVATIAVFRRPRRRKIS